MKAPAKRRQPQQRRAQQTVEAVLDAVARVLKREGVAGVTTNRIAEVAGVSIGSLYQYFPDKRAIFAALRDRHVDAMARLVESKLVAQASHPLDALMRGLMDAMIEAHTIDPALHDLLLSQLPNEAAPRRAAGKHAQGHGDFDARLHGALRLAISARAHEFERPLDLDRMLFVLSQMVEALAHGVVLRRPPTLSLAAAKEEASRAVLAYLHACGKREGSAARGGRPAR
jgi:AcrR family transcriptional regulator